MMCMRIPSFFDEVDFSLSEVLIFQILLLCASCLNAASFYRLFDCSRPTFSDISLLSYMQFECMVFQVWWNAQICLFTAIA